MKIAIYLGTQLPDAGGGISFESSVIEALDSGLEWQNEYVVFSFFEPKKSVKNLRHVLLKPLPVTKAEAYSFKNRLQLFLIKLIMGKRLFDINKKLEQLQSQNQYNNPLNLAAKAEGCHAVWFPTPSYIPVQLPYLFTLWDLAHRQYPVFPEVNYEGFTWEERENLYKAAIQKAAVIITGTEVGKQEICYHYAPNPENIVVNPFPVPSFFYSNKQPIITTAPSNFLFYPAQFWPHKNHILLLDMLEILNRKFGIEMQLVFTGSDKGNLAHVRSEVNKRKLTKQVDFKGFVSNDELKRLYKEALALVFPTFFGPDNLPPLEAMACGCPVIASNVSGAAEQLSSAAIICDKTKPEEFANAVHSIYTNPEKRNALIQLGYTKVKDLSATNYIKNMELVFDNFSQIRALWK